MTHHTHDCAEELKEANLQVTEARIATIQFFERYREPIDAQAVIDHLQKTLGTNRATCFRILNSFTKNGLLRKLEFGEGKARYELANLPHHHHLICEKCGCLQDIVDTVIIPDAEKELGKKHKFLIKRHALEFFGLCENCQ